MTNHVAITKHVHFPETPSVHQETIESDSDNEYFKNLVEQINDIDNGTEYVITTDHTY